MSPLSLPSMPNIHVQLCCQANRSPLACHYLVLVRAFDPRYFYLLPQGSNADLLLTLYRLPSSCCVDIAFFSAYFLAFQNGHFPGCTSTHSCESKIVCFAGWTLFWLELMVLSGMEHHKQAKLHLNIYLLFHSLGTQQFSCAEWTLFWLGLKVLSKMEASSIS